MAFSGRGTIRNEPRVYPAMTMPSRSNAIRREPPRPRPPMSIQRRPDARVLQYSREERDWSTDIFGCVDEMHGETCIQATFCPCVLYANNRRRFEHLQTKGYPHPTLSVTKQELRQALQDERGSRQQNGGGGRYRRQQEEEEPGCAGCCPGSHSYADEDPRNHPNNNHDDDHDDDEYPDHHRHRRDRSEGGGFFNPLCLMHALTLPCGIALAFQAMFRGHVRKRYRVRGEVWEDGLAAFCCGPCQLVQESREIEAEERTFVLKPVDPPKSARGPLRMFTM